MAILDTNKYYYFRLRNGSPYSIKETIVPINTIIMHNYQEMTSEQIAFYLEHPTASIQEIVNCELNSSNVEPPIDLQDYIDQKIKDLIEACYNSVTITQLEYAMAEDKINNLAADSYYTTLQANNILKDFRSQSKKAMQVKDTYSAQIQSAITIDDVDTLYNQAIAAL